jgi:hypothetical protein
VDTLLEGLEAELPPGNEREIVIDMDAIAGLGADQPKPEYYYTSESQQTRYKCEHCGEFNDIRGRYGYCASCARRNNLQSMKASLAALRDKLNGAQVSAIEAVRTTVSEFDGCCRDLTAQLGKRIPMKPSRKTDLERLLFHDVQSPTISTLKSMFDVDLLRGLGSELAFTKLMTHRRHVYEHNGGVADSRYIQESGDGGVREGDLIRETQENAHRLIGVCTRMVENFDADFHEVFPPTEWPIEYFKRRRVKAAR